jgi:hypothetical protein
VPVLLLNKKYIELITRAQNEKNIMKEKKFPCKMEDIPEIGEFIINSAEEDIADLNKYSSVFTFDYLATIKTKIEICKELVQPSTVTKELKTVALQLYNESKNLRIQLNTLEKYLKLEIGKSNIAFNDIGLKSVRRDIIRQNIEGLLLNMKTSLIAMKRNQPVLEALNRKQTLIDEIETQLQKINSLNQKQHALISKRNRLISENINKFYDLWNSLKSIMVVARAVYRNVDEVKLKDYTIAQLKKRVNAKI